MKNFRKFSEVASAIGADGARVMELAGRSTGMESHSVALITHPAGTESRAHHHSVADEVYFVQAGHGRMVVAGEDLRVTRGDTVTIRQGQSHKLYNDGPDDLVLIVTCAPAFSPAEVIWEE